MDFGVFMPNGSNGYVISEAIQPYLPDYKHQKAIALEAEKQGFSFALPMIKFKGFGGSTGYWDHCLEPFTLVAALAAETKTLSYIPTVALLAMHPAYTARTIATLSNISDGRVGLNVVTGWNKPEYEQMGLWPGNNYYENRYEFASEYLAILDDLWTSGQCTRHSPFWKITDCHCLPIPKHQIPIYSAGQSPSGIKFCTEHATQRIVFGHRSVLTTLEKEKNNKERKKYGTILLFHLIVAATDEKARKIAENIIEKADRTAISNQIISASMDTNKGGTSEAHLSSLDRSLEEGNAAFNIIPVICGTPKTIAMKLEEVAERTGADGFMFSWNDFEIGIRTFGQEILPKLSFN